ncbi:hypothetical protein B0H16DRAFT_1463343 [Mycena metata]|uniref:Uncharacterized protein n=1 Tax=Mycena metata TaxID=1033252 RepID=A0AAD7IKA3_9AGAR|nr:hypothetical protein B0H16DRAFT_1463343 [Mycena metata]
MLFQRPKTALKDQDTQRWFTKILSTRNDRPQFRHVALGDINLLYETSISSKVYKIKIFVARISGEPSPMTVVKYEDGDEVWHPNVWQLFGVSTAPGLQALIYHDDRTELIPLAMYRRFHRPSSDLVWACIEGMLFKQFKDCSQHHHWLNGDHEEGLEPAICVKRNPPQIYLTMADLENQEGYEDLDCSLSRWHTPRFRYQSITTPDVTIYSFLVTQPHASLPETLCQRLDISHFLGTLIPIWIPSVTLSKFQTRIFLGSVVTQACQYGESFCPIAYIPHSCSLLVPTWQVPQNLRVQGHAAGDRFTFAPGSFRTSQIPGPRILARASVELPQDIRDMVNMTWLSQANKRIDPLLFQGAKRYRYGRPIIIAIRSGKVNSSYTGVVDGLAVKGSCFQRSSSRGFEDRGRSARSTSTSQFGGSSRARNAEANSRLKAEFELRRGR